MASVLNWIGDKVNRGLGISNKSLDVVAKVYAGASQQTILSFISSIAKTTIGALVGYISPVNSVIKFIMGNPLNRDTFVFVREHWFEVVLFLVDLIEPMKRFTQANSPDGQPEAAANDFNELDMTRAMNVHAVISQVQRTIMSLTALFTQKSADISTFIMDTRLATDSNNKGTSTTDVQTQSVSSLPGRGPETWLFINGIAGEYHWTTLAVQKLARRFFAAAAANNPAVDTDSEIRGIFNRSDGILWDLVECAGERNEQDDVLGINQSTASSRTAQALLEAQLIAVLRDGKGTDIIMIAHSQGCLLLRLVLMKLHSLGDDVITAAMQERLKVYTFGNPAFDWKEHEFVKYTEHFANKADFVAKLGVLRGLGDEKITEKSRYWCQKCADKDPKHAKQVVFRHNKQKGHLFGSQYRLTFDADYECIFGDDGQGSELLSR